MSNFKKRMESYRRHPGSFLLFLLVMLSALATFVVLLFLIAYILIKGVPNLKPSLFSWTYTTENASMLPSIVNTLIMTVLSLLIAVPLGIFSAIYLTEYAKKGNKLVAVVRLTTETLSGIPSIVYGLFGSLFFVTYLKWSSVRAVDALSLAMVIATGDAYDRGGFEIRSGYVPGGKLWSGSRKTAYGVLCGSAQRHPWNPLRRDPRYRPYLVGETPP